MDNTRLPDINRLKAVKKRLKQLPPQLDAVDTINWENRDVIAPYLDTDKKKVVERQIDFLKTKQIDALTLEQIQRKMKKR